MSPQSCLVPLPTLTTYANWLMEKPANAPGLSPSEALARQIAMQASRLMLALLIRDDVLNGIGSNSVAFQHYGGHPVGMVMMSLQIVANRSAKELPSDLIDLGFTGDSRIGIIKLERAYDPNTGAIVTDTQTLPYRSDTEKRLRELVALNERLWGEFRGMKLREKAAQKGIALN